MTRIAVSLALAALVAGAGPALAQAPAADDAAILGVIDQFMHAVTSGDTAAMARIRLEGTTTTIERPDPAGGRAWKIGNVMYTVEPDACPFTRPSQSSCEVRPRHPANLRNRSLRSLLRLAAP